MGGKMTKEYHQSYYENNKEKIKEASKTNRIERKNKDPEGYKEKKASWKRNNKKSIRNTHLKYTYRITIGQQEDMLKDQDYKCKLCLKDLKKINVDHDHKTGKIRGILCHSCNMGLGLFMDNVDLLKRAILYIGGV